MNRSLAERLYHDAKADRWRLPKAAFEFTLTESCRKAFGDRTPGERELSKYCATLHLEDLALACACAEGHAAAWDHFVLVMRPVLYRAADALDRSGEARDLADSLYAELYGIDERGAPRQSLLRYFHGRSSLGTWLRAVLVQRYVDRVRVQKRTAQLSDEVAARSVVSSAADPECPRLVRALRHALAEAVSALDPRDRLRLSCYYVEQLTLAQTGRLLKEHEATVSRQLSRTREALRRTVERQLRSQGLNEPQVQRCFECATEDPGPLDLVELFAGTGKETVPDRSI
jgi:RNA polymerase sigma-70 factor (ECF subfamily)